jgi:hypothetical protein
MLSSKQKSLIAKISQRCVNKDSLKPIWELIKKNMPFKFETVLLNYSETEEYEDALQEWIIVSNISTKKNHSRCICSKPITRRYFILNELNGNVLCIGSSCIGKFKR